MGEEAALLAREALALVRAGKLKQADEKNAPAKPPATGLRR
jgi:hypothetical protein